MKTYRFLIKGRAQGVFYRKTIQEQAQAREIRGSIKNLPDGSVKVLAALTEEQLPSFLDLLKKGSPNSQVESISKAVIDGADLEYDSFIVRY
ncbi:MAG: acylphosphatase [Thiotrichales bacterium]